MKEQPTLTASEQADIAKLPNMLLCDIAYLIGYSWRKQAIKGINYAAKPYLAAMECLNDIKDTYGCDSGSSVVAYFLSNATSWKGPVARAVKAELNKRLKASY